MPDDDFDGLLLDLDGTLYEDGRALPGAVKAVARWRAEGRALRFVTNTTSKSRAAVAERLCGMGFAAEADEVHSPPAVAGARLRREDASAALFIPEATRPDFEGVREDTHAPNYVVLGDLGDDWTFGRLNEAFRLAHAGARLLALGRTRYWQAQGALTLDVGPIVAALEYATGQEALTLGKPAPAFFLQAVDDLGLDPTRLAVVGDDAETDVRAAIHAGLRGILVRTGKYRAGDERGEPAPTHVVDTVADLAV